MPLIFNNEQVLHCLREEQRYQHIFLLLNPFIRELRCKAREAAPWALSNRHLQAKRVKPDVMCSGRYGCYCLETKLASLHFHPHI